MGRKQRSWLILIAVLAVAAMIVARVPGPLGDASPAERIAAVRLADDGRRVVLVAPDGTRRTDVTIDDWRAWASRRQDGSSALPVRVGDADLGPEAFERFSVAGVGPSGRRALLATHAYAMLTDVSYPVLVGASGTFEPFGEIVLGTLGPVAWSPDGGHVAFAIGTARGAGVALQVRTVPGGAIVGHLDAEALLRAWSDATGEDAGAEQAFLPGVRRLEWRENGRVLAFSTDRPGAEPGTMRWTWRPGDGPPVPASEAGDSTAGRATLGLVPPRATTSASRSAALPAKDGVPYAC